MTTPIVPVTGYASVADYELRTGVDVPADKEPMVQTRLNDVSALFKVYMGPCADEVEANYQTILTSLACQSTQTSFAVTPGVRSETVGSTSVSYVDSSAGMVGGVGPNEAEVLDALMAACCGDYQPGGSRVGQLGVAYDRERSWAADVDIWLVSR